MKTKLFTTLALFFSLALTACGGAQAKWESNATKHWHMSGDKKVDEAAHDFDQKYDEVPATCAKEGSYKQKCKVCGYVKDSKVPKAAHDFGSWVNKDGAYCGPSEHEHECSVCHVKESEALPIVQHTWVKKGDGAEADGGVAYDIMECSECHKIAYFVSAAKATITNPSGKSKKDAPADCIKLGGDGDYMTVAFKIDAAKTGTFMLRGEMDYWYQESGTTNEEKTYYSQNSGHTDASTKTGNLKLEVGHADNLVNVELPDNTELKFCDMLPVDVASVDSSNHNWSTIGDCIVGKASLPAGVNTIKFTRVDSYNLAIHDFVFILDA